MTVTREQQKKLLIVLVVILAVLVVYRMKTAGNPATAPLKYPRGSVATSSVRTGILSPVTGGDPLQSFFVDREARFPGVARDIFRMENPALPKPKPKPVLISKPVPTEPPPPPVPVKTPEEIAAEESRADLSKFRFLGYLTEKDSTLFLSKEGELFMVKSGDTVLKNYKIKEAGNNYVVLLDTTTRVEMRVELSGGEQTPQTRMR